MADVPFFENPNVILGSWMGLSVYEADFGWGKPFHFGPGGVCPYDRGVISPRHGDDDVDVFMHFQVAHIQDFIIMFWEDIGNASCRTIEANI
ncbi:Spermidine hydroxycinnamoyl transferase [Arachis hypogaea]|nr:Spermidine hydroxycinnamoyl transferase [Arachis hypogaea]